MSSLVLDSSTDYPVVELIIKGELCYKGQIPAGRQSSRDLVASVEEGLRITGTTLPSLSSIIVGSGPGSYTGIRGSVVAASILAYFSCIPLIAVSTLKGLFPTGDGSFIAIIDAKVSGIYLIRGQRCGNDISYEGEPELCKLEEFFERAASVDLLVSPEPDAIARKVELHSPSFCLQQIEKTLPCGLALYQQSRGVAPVAPEKVDILYLRKTQPEIERLF